MFSLFLNFKYENEEPTAFFLKRSEWVSQKRKQNFYFYVSNVNADFNFSDLSAAF